MKPKKTKRPEHFETDDRVETLREKRYRLVAKRYDAAVDTVLRAARRADEARRVLDRYDRENERRARGGMTGEEMVKAIGGVPV